MPLLSFYFPLCSQILCFCAQPSGPVSRPVVLSSPSSHLFVLHHNLAWPLAYSLWQRLRVWGRDRHRVCLIGSLLSRYSPPCPLCSSLHRCQLHKYTNLQTHTLSSQIGLSSASGFDLVVNFALTVPILCPSSCPSVDLGPSSLIIGAISSLQTHQPSAPNYKLLCAFNLPLFHIIFSPPRRGC